MRGSEWLAYLGVLLLAGCIVVKSGAKDDDEADGSGNRSISGFVPPSPGPTVSGSGGGAATSGWSCIEASTGCECSPGFGNGRCEFAWPCCIASSTACACGETTNCEAEAASRPAASVVPACPPGAEDLPVACADAGENCRDAYLQEQELAGCCEGLLCKANESGVPVCQSGTPDELAQSEQCRSARTPTWTVEGPIVSSAGEITFDSVSQLRLTLDSAARVGTLSLELQAFGNTQCYLALDAGSELDANGGLVVTSFRIVAFGDPCPGFPSALTSAYDTNFQGGTFVGSVRTDGFSCETRLPGDFSATPCFAGTIELHLNGTLEALDIDTLSFDAAVLRLSGNACSNQL